MTPHNHISSELAELGSSLKASELTGRVLTVPAGFFEGFAGMMLLKLRALDVTDELEALSPLLASASRISPFTVQPGYFEERAVEIPSEKEIPSLLRDLQTKNPFTVPAGYFENLQLPLMAGDVLDKQDPASPLLDSISRETPYTLPAGYFQSLDPLSVVVAEAHPSAARVIGMRANGWMRYAAAAVVISFVAASAFFFINRNSSAGADDASIARTMKNVSTEEIDEVIELADEQVFYAVNARDADEISKLVSSVPEKDIQDFLNDTEGAESDIDEDPLLN